VGKYRGERPRIFSTQSARSGTQIEIHKVAKRSGNDASYRYHNKPFKPALVLVFIVLVGM
ncbi:hypothetical protein HAX54_032125, partial [Datura stramonium]|nr:hypothetical protein [Datura stramonium]